jgi:soluble lytic murein transglycosylase-like protein
MTIVHLPREVYVQALFCLRVSFTLALAGTLFFPSFCRAAPTIYKFQEPDGTIRFTTNPPPPGVFARIFTSKGERGTYSRFRRGFSIPKELFFSRYHHIIAEASRVHDVDMALIKAVIHAESAFNPQAISRKGAMGLMQLMPDTARLMGVTRPFSVEDNVFGGVRYLSKLLRRFQGNLVYAIAAYNAGENAVERFGGIPPFAETQDYVRKVLALKTHYRAS